MSNKYRIIFKVFYLIIPLTSILLITYCPLFKFIPYKPFFILFWAYIVCGCIISHKMKLPLFNKTLNIQKTNYDKIDALFNLLIGLASLAFLLFIISLFSK